MYDRKLPWQTLWPFNNQHKLNYINSKYNFRFDLKVKVHKEPSIISRNGAAIWSKTNFGSTGYHHPRSMHEGARVCTVSSISKCILEVVFCEGVQHRLPFCLHHLSSVKMAASQFYLQSGKERKVGWAGDDSHVVFGKRIPWWKIKCETVRCSDATHSSFSAKFRSEVFAHFQAVAAKSHSSMKNWLLDLPGQILCEQFPSRQRKWRVCYSLCSSPVSLFTIPESLDRQCTAHAFFLERFSNNFQCLCHTFPRFAQNVLLFLCRIHREIKGIKGIKEIKGTVKISSSTKLRAIFYTDSQDILELLFTVASSYYNCYADGSTSPGNYGYPLVDLCWASKQAQI
jgi:hypothetical protein